jgi:hypothetical protein
LAGSLFVNLFEFFDHTFWQNVFNYLFIQFIHFKIYSFNLQNGFANWMNKSNSDFNSLGIDRICWQCLFTRNCEIEKNCKKKSANLPHLRGKMTIFHCSKISRSNFENLQLSISWKIRMPTCTTKFLTTNPTGCFSNK